MLNLDPRPLFARWQARRALARISPYHRVLHALATGCTYPPSIAALYRLTLTEVDDELRDLEIQGFARPQRPRLGGHLATCTRYVLTGTGDRHAAYALLPDLAPGTPVGWVGEHLCIRPGQHPLPVAQFTPLTALLERV